MSVIGTAAVIVIAIVIVIVVTGTEIETAITVIGAVGVRVCGVWCVVLSLIPSTLCMHPLTSARVRVVLLVVPPLTSVRVRFVLPCVPPAVWYRDRDRESRDRDRDARGGGSSSRRGRSASPRRDYESDRYGS